MMALGYAKNKAPFLELSSRLPLRVLESLAQGQIIEITNGDTFQLAIANISGTQNVTIHQASMLIVGI